MAMEDRKLSVAFVTIATNKYVWYWKNLIISADLNLKNDINYMFHVFTDQPDFCKKVEESAKNVEVRIHQIRPLVWPEATLLKYETINNAKELINAEIVVHIDADSVICEDLSSSFLNRNWQNGVALVSHPGFWRPKGIKLMRFYFLNISFLIKDLYKTLKIGGLGTWDINPISTAYVARSRRKKYVCGGIWMGEKAPLFRMMEELSQQTKTNLDNGIQAKWFDESHLNNWAAFNESTVLTPNFCFAQEYKNLEGFMPSIIAVDKKFIFPPEEYS
jgi:hypothetical protein